MALVGSLKLITNDWGVCCRRNHSTSVSIQHTLFTPKHKEKRGVYNRNLRFERIEPVEKSAMTIHISSNSDDPIDQEENFGHIKYDIEAMWIKGYFFQSYTPFLFPTTKSDRLDNIQIRLRLTGLRVHTQG